MSDPTTIITTVINALNNLTPLGLAAGIAYIVYLQVKNKKEVATISDNHLSGLPEMAATLARMEGTLNIIAKDIGYLMGRRNGK